LIFENFKKLILSLEDNFKTEEAYPMCPHHKNEHRRFMTRVEELKHDLEVHIEEHDKGLIEKVCSTPSLKT